MVTPKPFLSGATADRIKALKQRGAATTQLLQDPAVTITFTRKGVDVASDVKLIRIRLDRNQPQEAGQGFGAQEVRTSGTLKVWAGDVDGGTPETTVTTGDTFIWDNQPCRITNPGHIRSGFRVMTFDQIGGVRA